MKKRRRVEIAPQVRVAPAARGWLRRHDDVDVEMDALVSSKYSGDDRAKVLEGALAFSRRATDDGIWCQSCDDRLALVHVVGRAGVNTDLCTVCAVDLFGDWIAFFNG